MARVRADLLLVAKGLAESRARAKAAIEAGGVLVGDQRVSKASELVDDSADLTLTPAHPWVGRGALKLVRAFEVFDLPESPSSVLDVGSSTGGFTEVCLSRGAQTVYAVDVGRDQLHPKLRADPRVVVLEGVDARHLTPALIPIAPGLVVCDASFIGLAKVLPAALGVARNGADLIALVKPQFEVGPGVVGKGGLVTDPAIHQRVIEAVGVFLSEAGWTVVGVADSPITGGSGQVEFLIHARKAKPQG